MNEDISFHTHYHPFRHELYKSSSKRLGTSDSIESKLLPILNYLLPKLTIESINRDSENCLHSVISHNYLMIFQLLFQYNIKINEIIINTRYQSPIFHVFNLLLQVDRYDNDKCIQSYSEMFKVLIRNKINFNIQNNNNVTFFDCFFNYFANNKCECHQIDALLQLYYYFIDYEINIFVKQVNSNNVITLCMEKLLPTLDSTNFMNLMIYNPAFQSSEKITNYYYKHWLCRIQKEQRICCMKSNDRNYRIGMSDISIDILIHIYSFLKEHLTASWRL